MGTRSLATICVIALVAAATGHSSSPAPSCTAGPSACPVHSYGNDHVLLQLGQHESPRREPSKTKRHKNHVENVAAAPDSDVRRKDETGGDAGDVAAHMDGHEGETAELEAHGGASKGKAAHAEQKDKGSADASDAEDDDDGDVEAHVDGDEGETAELEVHGGASEGKVSDTKHNGRRWGTTKSTGGSCTPGHATGSIASSYCCCDLGGGTGEVVKGAISYTTYACRDTSCRDAFAPPIVAPAAGFAAQYPDWRGRFADSGDGGVVMPDNILNELFTQEKWENAVRIAFGEDALLKAGPGPGPRAPDDPAVSHPSLQASFDRVVPLVMPPGHVPDKITEPLGDKAWNRAMSLANLRKVRTFIEHIVEREGRWRDHIINPSVSFGNACTNPENEPCKNENDCATKCLDGGRMQQRVRQDKVSMNILDKILVRPLTYYSDLSLVGHIGGGTPTVFVSHTWGGHFFSFLRSVEAHFSTLTGATAENTYYWVCTFGVNQHHVSDELVAFGSNLFGPFYYGIQLAQSVLAVQDDEQDGLFTLKRQWCAFEMMVTLRFDKPLEFACHTGAIFGDNGWVGKDGTPGQESMVCQDGLRTQMQGWSVTGISNYKECVGTVAPALGAHVALMPGREAWCDGADPRMIVDIVNYINDYGCEATAHKMELLDHVVDLARPAQESGAHCVADLFHTWAYMVAPRQRFGRGNRVQISQADLDALAAQAQPLGYDDLPDGPGDTH